MQVCQLWHSEMLVWDWMDTPVWKKNKKMQVCQPWHSGMAIVNLQVSMSYGT